MIARFWRENYKPLAQAIKFCHVNTELNFILERQNHTGMKLILLSCEESLSLC